MNVGTKLEEQSREELLNTVRHVMVEAEALSSRIVAVSEIGIAINSTLDIDRIFKVVANQAKWLLDFEHCSICVKDEDGGWALKVLNGKEFNPTTIEVCASEIGQSLKYGHSQLLKIEKKTQFLPHLASKIIVPLNSENEIIGTINFGSNDNYTHDDMRIAYLLALQLASAIRNASRMRLLSQAQEQLELYAHELENQNQELDAYSHTIAHDLKSPLSVIPVKAGLVKMYAKSLPSKAVDHLDDITERTKHMAEMIDQLLLLSKIRDAEEVLHPVAINPVVDRAVSRFSEIELKKVGLKVQANMPSVIGHAQWLEEVFANLVSNAIKYRGDDNAHLCITIYAKTADDKVTFYTQDNGVGIHPEDHERLFQKFTRLHSVNAEGLGLGLSIINRIIYKLGGELGVDSEWGIGSIFWFSLPLAP